jgi:hypothetical protein
VPANPANASSTPSETLNQLAHVPVNAINKAKDAVAARRASEQTRVDAAADGEDVARTGAGNPAEAAKTPAPGAKTATVMTSLAPGLSASTRIEAAAEASAAFRSFVANAKVSGVFQGDPPRAFINGRLARVGEVIEPALGIVFNGVDSRRTQLLFKDKTGATVARKY